MNLPSGPWKRALDTNGVSDTTDNTAGALAVAAFKKA